MFEFLKRLFKKKPSVVEIREVFEVKIKIPKRYNIRDKKGRFVKKGVQNGKRR